MKGRFSASVLRRDSFPHCASLPSKTSPATMTGSSVTGRCVTPKFVSPWHPVPNNINIRWRREWPHWVGVQVGGCVIREYSSFAGATQQTGGAECWGKNKGSSNHLLKCSASVWAACAVEGELGGLGGRWGSAGSRFVLNVQHKTMGSSGDVVFLLLLF